MRAYGWRRAGALGLVAVVLLLGACIPGNNGGAWGPGGSQGDTSTRAIHAHGGIVVAIVPDIEPAMEALIPAWTAAHPDIPLVFTVAPAVNVGINQNTYIDVDAIVTDLLEVQQNAVSQGLLRSTGVPIAASGLSFVTPASNPGRVTRLQDTARPGLHLVNVYWPSGVAEATQAALERMMRLPEFARPNIPCAGSYASCTYSNVVLTLANGVMAAQTLAGRPTTVPLTANQRPLGGAFVYHANFVAVERAMGSGTLREIPVPTGYAPPQGFWYGLSTFQGVNPGNARLFQAFLLSPRAQAVFASYGFLPPSAAPAQPQPVTP